MKLTGLRRRLGRVFIAQVLVIGLATLVGVAITQVVVEDLLTRRALDLEAEHFWDLLADNSQTPLPNTANLRGYLLFEDSTAMTEGELFGDPAAMTEGERLPANLISLTPGYTRAHVHGHDRLVHVTERGNKRLYLVFNADRVSDLAFYFGLLPLSIVLLLMYVLLFVAYRWSHRAISPMISLARKLEVADIKRSGQLFPDLDALRQSSDAEVLTMIDALDRFASRLDAALERERIFTRGAGHELRTPLAVLKGSLELIERLGTQSGIERSSAERQALVRMGRTLEDMEALLETLLLLAREESVAQAEEDVLVCELAAEQIEVLAPLAARRGNQVTLDAAGDLRLRCPPRALQILLDNLLRNALTYTDQGQVKVSVHADGISVSDSGIGMSRVHLASAFKPFYRADFSREETPGHGLGLAIVRRLSEQLGWQVQAQSQPGTGTTIEVRWA